MFSEKSVRNLSQSKLNEQNNAAGLDLTHLLLQHTGNIQLLSKLPALYSNDLKRNRRSSSGGALSAKNFTSFRRRNSASIDADIRRSAE